MGSEMGGIEVAHLDLNSLVAYVVFMSVVYLSISFTILGCSKILQRNRTNRVLGRGEESLQGIGLCDCGDQEVPKPTICKPEVQESQCYNSSPGPQA